MSSLAAYGQMAMPSPQVYRYAAASMDPGAMMAPPPAVYHNTQYASAAASNNSTARYAGGAAFQLPPPPQYRGLQAVQAENAATGYTTQYQHQQQQAPPPQLSPYQPTRSPGGPGRYSYANAYTTAQQYPHTATGAAASASTTAAPGNMAPTQHYNPPVQTRRTPHGPAPTGYYGNDSTAGSPRSSYDHDNGKRKLQFSRKPRVVDFKPYTLTDYRVMKPRLAMKLGGLDPNTSNPEYVAKKAAQSKRKKYAEEQRARNKRRLAAQRKAAKLKPAASPIKNTSPSKQQHSARHRSGTSDSNHRLVSRVRPSPDGKGGSPVAAASTHKPSRVRPRQHDTRRRPPPPQASSSGPGPASDHDFAGSPREGDPLINLQQPYQPIYGGVHVQQHQPQQPYAAQPYPQQQQREEQFWFSSATSQTYGQQPPVRSGGFGGAGGAGGGGALIPSRSPVITPAASSVSQQPSSSIYSAYYPAGSATHSDRSSLSDPPPPAGATASGSASAMSRAGVHVMQNISERQAGSSAPSAADTYDDDAGGYAYVTPRQGDAAPAAYRSSPSGSQHSSVHFAAAPLPGKAAAGATPMTLNDMEAEPMDDNESMNSEAPSAYMQSQSQSQSQSQGQQPQEQQQQQQQQHRPQLVHMATASTFDSEGFYDTEGEAEDEEMDGTASPSKYDDGSGGAAGSDNDVPIDLDALRSEFGL